jgi:crotonobetainyl-CoA:carnitine CoA-transferase CaiB-like acyl-CoA transferase
MLEGQLGLLGTMIGSYLTDGVVPEPMGTAYKALLPYQTFRTKTRDLALAVGSEKLWQVFCPLIGRPDMTNDPRFNSNRNRDINRAQLIDQLQQVFLTRTYEEWEKLLVDNGIPMGAINNLAEAVNHPQVQARGALVEVEHPVAGRMKMVGAPVRLSATPGGVRTPSPTLGQHTDEVLREVLSLDDAELAALRSGGALG